ncbi:hypothetical protein [Nitrosopumilus sp.]|uniref:hypothetical protein n=1 Tax=Nitrosopumilus sp. TaxID=2024843 RepID=UPI003D0D791F
MTNLSKYKAPSDSVKLSLIDGQPFTITDVQDNVYKDDDKEVPSVVITTEETFSVNIEGDDIEANKFHTTREVVVETLSNKQLREDLANGETLKVKCEQPKGKRYFVLVDA